MKRFLLIFFICLTLLAAAYYYFLFRDDHRIIFPSPSFPTAELEKIFFEQKLNAKATTAKNFVANNNLSDAYCMLIDMSIPSGKKRFFIYDLQKDTIASSGLVSHGNCNSRFMKEAAFSNVNGSGCSSLGKYKIGYSYNGQFGKAYKLYGLDKTNSNAFERFVVLHAYTCVPDEEVHPKPICNSSGCPMISYKFLDEVADVIDGADKPVLLWVYQ